MKPSRSTLARSCRPLKVARAWTASLRALASSLLSVTREMSFLSLEHARSFLPLICWVLISSMMLWERRASDAHLATRSTFQHFTSEGLHGSHSQTSGRQGSQSHFWLGCCCCCCCWLLLFCVMMFLFSLVLAVTGEPEPCCFSKLLASCVSILLLLPLMVAMFSCVSILLLLPLMVPMFSCLLLLPLMVPMFSCLLRLRSSLALVPVFFLFFWVLNGTP
mmetsp:Transcript_5383/g.9888  ORF Transcript_5383/g.9888 Transcript_5383/m.9888 type:complete len:220 (+) Transcript_5383:3474-4133(+)